MTKLFSEKEYENAKGNDKLPMKCEQCGKTFYVRKKDIKYSLKRMRPNDYKYCSKSCAATSKNLKGQIINTICKNCGKPINVLPCAAKNSKSGNHFCCKSCAAKYNNTHKAFGTRRSKLEAYLEEKLTELYPELEIKYNSKEEINSELDIYIPKYKLAFELNGIFHYEPIYGVHKFQQIQENDKNKFQLCQENKISLCIIDTSSLKNFKERNAEKYLDIIKNIINDYLII